MLRSTVIVLATLVLALVAFDAAAQEHRGRGGRDGGRDNVTINKYYGGRGGGGGRSYSSYRRPGYRYDSGRGWYDPSAVIGGAIGGWLWRQWAQPEPQVIEVPAPYRDEAWCMNRYKSYDPYTKTYLGYDGLRHGCP